MTQNLIVKNDSDSEYVQFDVLLPDNYSKFTIDYLNGCCINQNYLKIGDKLKFSFSNNPIVYDKLKLHAHCVNNMGVFHENPKEYERLELDTFKYYRIKYLPIYEFWNKTAKERVFLFNPCGELHKNQPKIYVPNLIFDEPDTSIVPSHVYICRVADPRSSLECAFTGQFIIAFEPVDKIPDITITIGESINNSKQRPEDLGEYAIASNVVNSLKTNKINYNPSNYGSSWTYPIHNLMIQHRETITQESETPVTYRLAYAENTENKDFIASSRTLFQQYIYNGSYSSYIQEEPLYMEFKEFSSNQLNDINTTIYTGPEQHIIPHKYPVFAYDSDNNMYVNIYNNMKYKGDELSNESIYFYDGTESHTDITPKSFNPSDVKYVNPSWYYTGDTVTIKVLYEDNGEFKPVPNTFENITIRLEVGVNTYDSATKPVRINFKESSYEFYIEYELNGQSLDALAVFQIQTNDSDDSFTYLTDDDEEALDPHLYIAGYLHLTDGIATIVNNVHTGLATAALTDGRAVSNDWQDQPIQLSSRYGLPHENDEDLLISETSDRKGLYVTKAPLNNVSHLLHNIQGGSEVYNKMQQWENDTGTLTETIKVFIPKKSTRSFTPYFHRQYCRGFFILTDSDGNVTQDLLDNKTMYYLASGHETLNIEPENIDDETFKTFNGSLNFDRSNSRITRIFSNDVTGACLNYLNDLLAAKLSRFYYESDVCTYDSFFDTSNKLIMNGNHRAIYGYYNTYQLYTGEHKTIMSTCGDMVKLIGSENLPNNCFSIISSEEQKINTNPITYREATDAQHGDDNILKDPIIHTYKFFHCYTSGTEEIPYVGYGTNDSKETTIGGVSTFNISNEVLQVDFPENNEQYKNGVHTTYKTNYIMDVLVGGNDETNKVKEAMVEGATFPTNYFLDDCGMVDTLPSYRLYRNSNFEQSDLTITTGGVKTLHPIYLQSVPRVFINNIIYFFDYILNAQQKNQWFNSEGIYNYFYLYTRNTTALAPSPTTSWPVLRFGKWRRQLRIQPNNNRQLPNYWMAESLDSAFIMNYLNNQSINDYLNIKELNESIPSPGNQSKGNEEIIYNFETSSELTNIQLFSSKYFRFFDEVENLNMVQFKMKYVDGVSMDQDLLLLYVTQKNIDNNFINPNNFINDVTAYNNLKTGKLFICKLGEFLQFSHILYLSSESFNNSLNVAIDNLNMSKYKTPFEGTFKYRNCDITQSQVTTYEETFKPNPEQRKNVYLFGVMFRFHQLSLGWSNLNNEISQQYEINRSLGNRHFILTLYDEFGRRIPNKDTSQGFKNNLTVELMLECDDLTASGQGQ